MFNKSNEIHQFWIKKLFKNNNYNDWYLSDTQNIKLSNNFLYINYKLF